jgi:hypothetical protein
VRLFYLDESGFSPSLPTGYSWCLPRQPKRVKYGYPQGRRVNALATYEPQARCLDAVPFEPVFKQVKHHEMPTRSFTTRADLRKAVEDGFDTYRRRLQAKGDNELRLAA